LIATSKIEDLIRQHVGLGNPDSRGFYSFKCQSCNDYKVRAGFKFDNGQIGFNCWNCGLSGRFEEYSGKMSGNFRKILTSHGVKTDEIDSVLNSAFFIKEKPQKAITLSTLSNINTETPPVKLPPKSIKLGSAGFESYQEKILNYLLNRKVNVLKYPFYFSLEERFIDKVIIPFYRAGKLIYWQARSIDGADKKRYDNAAISRDAVMFNYDKLYANVNYPLIVTEGVFDALMLDGIALLGSKLTAAKEHVLKSSRRELIFVIDKDKVGKHLGLKAIENGWKITFLPTGISDLNDCVQKVGLAASAFYLRKNIPLNNDHAQMLLNLYCQK
jgi:hypothetical protein